MGHPDSLRVSMAQLALQLLGWDLQICGSPEQHLLGCPALWPWLHSRPGAHQNCLASRKVQLTKGAWGDPRPTDQTTSVNVT